MRPPFAPCAARAAWVLALVLGVAASAAARPDYLARYQADPLRRADVNGCGTCHVKPDGGGARNDFGAAFDAANREITPILRASYPRLFDVASAKLPDGTTFFMADPASTVVVVERGGRKVAVDVAALVAPKAAPLPPADNRMTFFVSSHGVPDGGKLGGLAGADRFCQDLAKAAGAGDRPWRAYLSTAFKGAAAVNAGDRIGGGPWHNARGDVVARGPLDLHRRGTLPAALFLTETGEPVAAGTPVLTGSEASGLAAPDATCANWTGAAGERAAGGRTGEAWNAGATVDCGAPAPAPRLYCFSPR
ncbi:MAG: hypothetical protein AB7O28_02165 [Vicinamibacterales bacterium]